MENIMIGFSNVFQLSNLFICIGGLMVGVLFGALPGFSATMAVAVFVPFTYVMEPGPALLLLSALYCGGVYDEVDVVCDVFRFLGLAIVDVCAAFFEVLGQGRAVPVGAGYGKALG